MVKKYMNKTFNNDSSSNSEHHDEIENKEIDIKHLKEFNVKVKLIKEN
jgi:hypothetical protein